MKEFRYRARRADGELDEGVLVAESAEAVARTLSDRGLFSVSIEEAMSPPRRNIFVRRRWSLSDQALFARQLADLVGGDLTVERALVVLEEQATDAHRREVLLAVRRAVREGRSLSQALAQIEPPFPATVVSAVRAGEASGALEAVLGQVAELLEREDATLRKVRQALAYPALVAGVALVTLVILFVHVVPRVAILYADLGQTLPLPTRMLIGGSKVAGIAVLPSLAVLGVATLLGLRSFRTSERTRVRVATAALALPAVGPILLLREAVRFCRVLGTLLAGGVPVLEALSHCADSIGNAHLAREIRGFRTGVHDGRKLSQVISGSSFHGPLGAMVRVGEESGDLPRALDRAACIYDRDLDGRLGKVTTYLEPVLLLGVGLFVAFVVFAMMLPILQMDLGIG